jgi:hypothetical protein
LTNKIGCFRDELETIKIYVFGLRTSLPLRYSLNNNRLLIDLMPVIFWYLSYLYILLIKFKHASMTELVTAIRIRKIMAQVSFIAYHKNILKLKEKEANRDIVVNEVGYTDTARLTK